MSNTTDPPSALDVLGPHLDIDTAARIVAAVESPPDCAGVVQREPPVSPALYVAALARLSAAGGRDAR